MGLAYPDLIRLPQEFVLIGLNTTGRYEKSRHKHQQEPQSIREHWALRRLMRWDPDPAQAKTAAICLTAAMIFFICNVAAFFALRKVNYLFDTGMKTLM